MSNHIADANKMVGEDHIRDATKMVSDTPRTDAHSCHDLDYDDPLHAFADFAKQLERELNAATSEIERLRKANLQLREGAEEQKQRIKRLEEFVDQLTNPKFTRDDLPKEALLQRIKRLEEAGDELVGTTDVMDTWIKAKEAKP